MKTIDAPLCMRCADLLRDSFPTVEERVRFGYDRRECAWCQRESAAAIFRLHVIKK